MVGKTSKPTAADTVRGDFLEAMLGEASAVNEASDVAWLRPRAGSGAPPQVWDGVFDGVEHFEPMADGTVAVSGSPVHFSISFPTNYLRSGDPRLQFQVGKVLTPIVHPNVSGGVVCLGPHFMPGTGLRALVEQLYGIVSGRTFATNHAFDATARQHFLSHLDEVKALQAKPLWRRKLAQRIRTVATAVERVSTAAESGEVDPGGRSSDR